MAFERDQAVRGGLFDELRVKFGARRDEGNIHDGAELFLHAVGVEGGVVDEIVQKSRLVLVDLVHLLHAAQLFQPAQDQRRHVDGEAGGRIVQALVLVLHLPFEHGGAGGKGILNEVAPCDDDGHARGSKVFLGARIDDAEIPDVDLAREDLGRHVGDERRFRAGEFRIPRAENGVVGADVHIIRIFAEGDGRRIGNIRIGLVLGGGDAGRIAVDLALLPCLFGKIPRDDIVRFSAVHQIEGNCGKLRGSAALHKQHGIVFGDPHELAQQGFPFVHDRLKGLVAVGDLRNGHARSRKIQQIALCFFQNFERKRGRTCREVVSSHGDTS